MARGRLPMRPQCGVAGFELGHLRFDAISQSHDYNLPNAAALGSIRKKLSVRRRLRVIVQRSIRRIREPFTFAIERDLE